MLELGALVPTRGLYLNTAHDDKIEELVEARALRRLSQAYVP